MPDDAWYSQSQRGETTNGRAVFARFGTRPADNLGRLMRFELGGVRVIVDYAHNPAGLRGLLTVADRMRGGGRVGQPSGALVPLPPAAQFSIGNPESPFSVASPMATETLHPCGTAVASSPLGPA